MGTAKIQRKSLDFQKKVDELWIKLEFREMDGADFVEDENATVLVLVLDKENEKTIELQINRRSSVADILKLCCKQLYNFFILKNEIFSSTEFAPDPLRNRSTSFCASTRTLST